MILGDPSPEAWDKLHRYASWMRKLHLGWFWALRDDTLLKFRLNLPAGGWFPALQELHWCIAESNIPSADLCFSPDLKRVSFSLWLRDNSGVPHKLLPAAASIIFALPTSALQSILIDPDPYPEIPWAVCLNDAFSSAVLRCGPSLTEFTSPILLSDAAINHLIRLPRLRTLWIECPPPNYSASSLPLVFPPLVEFTLGGGAVHGWLSLFKRLGYPDSTTQIVKPLSRVKESLRSLNIEIFPSPVINSSFTSPIQIFYNLVSLNVKVRCHDESRVGQCGFKLNNGDITHLAMALSRLESLLLGHPCFENICPATVVCLLSVFVFCTKLGVLEIHFNTANITEDFKSISEDPQLRELQSLPRSTLTHLHVGQIPLALDELGSDTVTNGMVDIFPSLQSCQGYGITWGKVNRGVKRCWERRR